MHKLLDDYLCKKYPKIFVERNLPPRETCMCWGFTCDSGWFYLIERLCKNIQNHIDERERILKADYDWVKERGLKKIPQVVAKQVKEKFAGLRFYYDGGDEKIAGMVDLAEELSYFTCEQCGRQDSSVSQN